MEGTTMPNADDFAARLQSLRERAGLSQYELARRTGLTRQTVSRLEMGDRDPTWGTVQLLALALGADFREFADPDVKLPDVTAPARGRPPKPDASPPGPKRPRGRPPKAPAVTQGERAAGKTSEDTTAPKRAPRGKKKSKGE
jgi:transcriptional regulator with XRE-family HTH domain